MLWLSWILLLFLAESSSSAKILGGSAVGGSHYMVIRNVMEELAARGHEVTLVAASATEIKPSERISHKVFQVPYATGTTAESIAKVIIEKGMSFEVMMQMDEMRRVVCNTLLNSTDFLESLRGHDLIIHDAGASCSVLLAEYLDIKRVEILPAPPNAPFVVYHKTPLPLSYIPQIMPGYTDKMTFLQRVVNVGSYVATRILMEIMSKTMNDLKAKYNIRPEISFQEATGKAELVLITADFALEYPQPLLPGNIMVGQLNFKEAKPLSPELEEFVSGSDHGFILVSFGSNVASLAKEKVDKLAEAFGKLKQRVVWRLKGYIPASLSSNIKAMRWLPQNDLLGHKNIKAFVSHVGHNSLYESAYHGVPVVAFPLFADQFFNARKVEYFGLGLQVDHNSFDSEQLFKKINKVITEPRFKNEAVRISHLLKDRSRTPLQTTGDWIEYVLRHDGAPHLRPQVFNIPWYQYYLLDVMAFLATIVTLVVMVIRLTCKCLCRVCCKSDNKSKME